MRTALAFSDDDDDPEPYHVFLFLVSKEGELVTQEGAVPAGYLEQVRRIAREEAAKVFRSAPLRNSNIGSGGSGLTVEGDLTVAGGRFRANYSQTLGGGEAVYIGDMYSPYGVYLGTGLLIQAPDGTDLAMFRYDQAFAKTRWDLYDSGNRVIVGNDASSGQGIARPYLDAGTPRLTRYNDWGLFNLAATSTYETVYSWSHVKQHPRLEVCVFASMDTAATTGTLRIMVDGVQLGSDASLAFAQGPNYFGPANVAGSHMQVLDVQVQIQRTTATGGVKLAPAFCRGRQSP